MNRNRFKNRTSSKVGQLNISIVTGNSSTNTSPSSDTAASPKSPVLKAHHHNFRLPKASPKSPKQKKSPVKRMLSSRDFGDQEHVTMRKTKRLVFQQHDDLDKPFFDRVLDRCGLCFNQLGDTPHSLKQEQIFFVRCMEEQMEDDPLKTNVEEFIRKFKLLHDNDDRLFKKSLSPTKAAEDQELTGDQESLIHLLLEVSQLQTPLMNFLFEKLINHVVEEGIFSEGLDDAQWSSLILKQMCNLSVLTDSETFTDQLLKMLELANPPIQKIFLSVLPRIIFDEQQQKVATVLSLLLKEGRELTPQILDSLSSLMTSRDVRERVIESVVAMLKKGSRKFLPQVITFLLMETQFSDDLHHIVGVLRRDVDLTPYGVNATQQAEQASTMVKVVATLKVNLNSVGEVGEIWLTAVVAAANVTMLDLVVLILLFSQGDPTRCKTILGILRTKSSAGSIKEQTLDQLLTHHGKTLGEKLDALLDIASHLIQNPNRTVSHHGALWFKLLFLHIEGYQRQQVMYKIITIVGLCSPLATQNALWVLLELVKNNLPLVLSQSGLLMSSDGLLERVESVDLDHARQIMDVLCCLAYSGDASAEALQTDISILIKKQLACPQLTTKRKGIVGAVMATKHIAVYQDDDCNSLMEASIDRARPSGAPSECGSSLSLPAGHKAHQAQNLINLVRASTVMYPEINGFFYDELASMASTQALDHRFLLWLTDQMITLFQDEYIIDMESDIPDTNGVKLTPQFSLDGDANPIITSLGSLVVRDELEASGRKTNSQAGLKMVHPYVVCPLFRLVRILKYRVEEGSLEDIDALLGCPLQLPPVLQNLTRSGLISMSDLLEQKVVLNCLFLAINWLREVVNAFAFSKDQSIIDKVVQRIRHIVFMENKLAEILSAFPPDYNPPVCQFYADVLPFAKQTGANKKKKRANRKKAKKLAQSSIHPALDQSDNNLSEDDDEINEIESEDDDMEGQVSDLIPLQACFREMDMGLFSMLSRDFKIKVTPTQGTQVTPELGPEELVFLLEDLSLKLEHALIEGANSPKKGRPSAFQAATTKVGQPISATTHLHFHLDMFPCEKVVRNVALSTENICDKLEMVMNYFQALEERNDGLIDGPGSDSEYSKQMNRCFFLLLQCLRTTIAWNGFYTPQFAPLLLETLRKIAKRVDPDADSKLLPAVILVVCQYLKNFGSYVLQLPTAVALISLIQIVASHDSDEKSKEAPENKAIISKLCKTFLSRDWPAVPRGSAPAGPLVAEIVQAYMDNSEVKLQRAQKLLVLINDSGAQLKGKNAPGYIEKMPTINKNTLPPVYKVLATSVVAGAREACTNPENLTQAQSGSKLGRKVQAWSFVIQALHTMMSIAKHHETKLLLIALFKHCQPAFKLFVEHGMPALNKCFPHHPAEVQALLKMLQNVTRFLQTLCCHGKVTGTLGLVQLVPNMRFLLEKIVQRVKSMLVYNGCTQAFWMGNLKNKNLKGEEIPSQMSEGSDEDDDEREEEEERVRKKKRLERSQAETSVTQKSQKKTQKSSTTQKSKAGPSGTQISKAGPSGTQKSKTSGTQASRLKMKSQRDSTKRAKLNGTQRAYYKQPSLMEDSS